MAIIKVERYTEKDLQENPHVRYVFGDNMRRIGNGGQAAVCRDKPNAIGIPTLWAPGKVFSDVDYDEVKQTITNDFTTCMVWSGSLMRILVWPMDGIGTGFARLPTAAPRIWRLVKDLERELFRKSK